MSFRALQSRRRRPSIRAQAQDGRSVVQDGLNLAQDWSASRALWERYKQLIFAALPAAPKKPSTVESTLWIVIDLRADAKLHHLRRTVASARNVAQCAHGHTSVAVLAPGSRLRRIVPASLRSAKDLTFSNSLAGFLQKVSSHDLLLFVEAGDRIDARGCEALLQSALTGASLLLFDLSFGEGDKAYPILLHAADYVHALECDYFMSRFAVTGRALEKLPLRCLERDRYGIACALFEAEMRRPGTYSAVHLPLPIVDMKCSREQRARRLDETAGVNRRQHSARLRANQSVSVVICTKDKGHLLRQLLRTLTRDRRIGEIIVVSNQTCSRHGIETLREYAAARLIKLIDYDKPFNFSAQSNLGAAHATGTYLLFLNDDITPISEDWVGELIQPFHEYPRTAITGPLLLYPDECVQHAGMFLGHNNCGGHALRFARIDEDETGSLLVAPRQVSTVTGAAMMIRRDKFKALRGYDGMLAGFLQDIDICLRAQRAEWDVVFNPRAVLLHMESASVKRAIENPAQSRQRDRDFVRFHEQWADIIYNDPYHNPRFSLADESLRTLVPPQL